MARFNLDRIYPTPGSGRGPILEGPDGNEALEARSDGAVGKLLDAGGEKLHAATCGPLASYSDVSNTLQAAVDTAVNEGIQTVVVPRGDYLAADVEVSGSVHLDFQGSTIRCARDAANLFRFAGDRAVESYALLAPASRGDRTITLTTAPVGISRGDLIMLRDDTTRPGDGAGNINMEVHQVADVSSSTITLSTFVRLPKAVATENVYKILPIEDVHLGNARLVGYEGASVGQMGLYFLRCRNVRLRNIYLHRTIGPGISFRQCYDVGVEDFEVMDPQFAGSGQGYGVQFAQGTMRCFAKRGETWRLRHSIDSGGSFDLLVEDVDDHESVSGPFMVSHNSYDADQTWIRARAFDSANHGYIYAAPTDGTAYDYPAHNIRIIDGYASLRAGHGAYFRGPMVDCFVDVRAEYIGERDENAGNGLRTLPSGHQRSRARVRAERLQAAATLYHTSSRTPDDPLDGLVFEEILVRDCKHGVSTTFANALLIERAEFEQIEDVVLDIRSSASGAKLRRLELGDLTVRDHTVGNLLSFDENARHPQGILGRIGSVRTNLTTSANLGITDGAQLTQEQILTNKDGEILRVVASGTVTMASPPFPLGLVEGQRITLVSISGTINIPNGNGVLNNGGATVAIGSAKRSVSYAWTGTLWIQTA